MTVDVSLTTEGYVDFGDVKQALEAAGCSPVELQRVQQTDAPDDGITRIGHFEFRDPTNRRRTRQMRVHHFTDPDPESDPHIKGDEFSYCVMGAHDGGPVAMRALADAFGGKLRNEMDQSEEVVEKRSHASPAP